MNSMSKEDFINGGGTSIIFGRFYCTPGDVFTNLIQKTHLTVTLRICKYLVLSTAQCGNLAIFLQPRFYVKSINLESQNRVSDISLAFLK